MGEDVTKRAGLHPRADPGPSPWVEGPMKTELIDKSAEMWMDNSAMEEMAKRLDWLIRSTRPGVGTHEREESILASESPCPTNETGIGELIVGQFVQNLVPELAG